MAYAEKRGDGESPWRVKYMTPTGERSRSGFATETEAVDWGREQERDIRARRWKDPRNGEITFEAWVEKWTAGQDLAPNTVENYAYHLRTHILPRWKNTPLYEIETLEVDAWQADIRRRGYAPSSAAKARSLMVTILEDAVVAKRIDANPAHVRRGRGRTDLQVDSNPEESLWCTADQALEIAERAGILTGRPDEFVMVLLAAFTGMRLGEVRGLERKYAKPGVRGLGGRRPQPGSIQVQWQLRQVGEKFFKAPPKKNSRRENLLPPFLSDLVSGQMERTKPGACGCGEHKGDYLFRPPGGDHHTRAMVANTWFRPAAGGRLVPKGSRERLRVMVDADGRYVQRRRAETVERMCSPDRPIAYAVATWAPIVEGLTFHDLRHSHKTWMISAGVPEVAQAERLGHKIPGVRGVYSHATPEMRQHVVDAMQELFVASLKKRARKGPSALPVLQELLEPHLGPWKWISQIPPIGGAKIIEIRRDQAV